MNKTTFPVETIKYKVRISIHNIAQQDKFNKFISPTKGYLRETFKS